MLPSNLVHLLSDPAVQFAADWNDKMWEHLNGNHVTSERAPNPHPHAHPLAPAPVYNAQDQSHNKVMASRSDKQPRHEGLNQSQLLSWVGKEFGNAGCLGPTRYPPIISTSHPEFQHKDEGEDGKPSPLALYYFDETAPNMHLFDNELGPSLYSKLSRALQDTCNPRDTAPSHKVKGVDIPAPAPSTNGTPAGPYYPGYVSGSSYPGNGNGNYYSGGNDNGNYYSGGNGNGNNYEINTNEGHRVCNSRFCLIHNPFGLRPVYGLTE